MLTKEEQKVRTYLIELARSHRQIIQYSELSVECELGLDMYNNPSHRELIGKILGSVSYYEFTNDRPLLSSLVVSASNEQGDGYFKLCEDLGLGKWQALKRKDKLDMAMIKNCLDFWRDDIKYNKHKEYIQ